MRKLVIFLLIINIIVGVTGCNILKKSVVENSSSTLGASEKKVYHLRSEQQSEQKVYQIPSEQQKQTYSIEDFKYLYSEYLKLNNISSETSPENDKTEMSNEDKVKFYTIYDITPKEIKEAIGCQIFKLNYSCETFVVYKSKIFHIGMGLGGFGVVNLRTCDLDENGQEDLIYTFSFGSGLHRSLIGVLNLSTEKDEWFDFAQLNKDIMLEKISDTNFKIFIVAIDTSELNYSHLNLSKQEYVGDVQKLDGKAVIKSSNINYLAGIQFSGTKEATDKFNEKSTKEFDKLKSQLSLIPKEYDINNANEDGYFVILNQEVKPKVEIINKFVSDSENQKSTSITIVQYTVDGKQIISKITYDGIKYYAIEDDTRVTNGNIGYHEFEFKYLKVFKENNNKIYVLLNDKEIDYNKYIKSFLSSNSKDWIDVQTLCSYKD